MNVLLVNASGSLSGAERVLIRFAQKAVAEGHHVVLLCPSGPLVGAIPPEVEHRRVRAMSLAGARSGISVLKYVLAIANACWELFRLRRSSDIVVVNSTLASPLAFFWGRQCVWLLHDVLGSDLRGRLGKWAARFFKLVIPVSVAAADPVRNVARVRVVVNGTPVQHAPIRSHTATQGLTIGCLAALTPWKGHAVLLRAVELIAEKDFRLEIAGAPFPGDEEYANNLRHLGQQGRMADRIHFLGKVDGFEALARWDIMVLPSLSPEAMPLSILEALSMGVPCIATGIGGSYEILHEVEGELVPPNDAPAMAESILRLLESPARRKELADLGRVLVAKQYELNARTQELFSVIMQEASA